MIYSQQSISPFYYLWYVRVAVDDKLIFKEEKSIEISKILGFMIIWQSII